MAGRRVTRDAALHLGFLMFPGFPMACLTATIAPLRAANDITGQRHFDWLLVAEQGVGRSMG